MSVDILTSSLLMDRPTSADRGRTGNNGGDGDHVVLDDENSTTSSNNTITMSKRYSFTKLKMQLGAAGGGKLYGRQNEEEILRSSYVRCIQDCQQELILISGNPGTGKTALANTLKQVVATTASDPSKKGATTGNKGFFVAGKFDEHQVSSEPYEVFISALTDYTDQLLDSYTDEQLNEVRSTVRKAVGIEGKLLTDIIPALKQLIPISTSTQMSSPNFPEQEHPKRRISRWHNATNNPGNYNNSSSSSIQLPKLYGTAAQDRFRFVFCNFIKALTKMAPLVLFLDDLQWADTASCEMVRNLMHTKDDYDPTTDESMSGGGGGFGTVNAGGTVAVGGGDGDCGNGMKLLIIGAHRCELNAEQKQLSKQQQQSTSSSRPEGAPVVAPQPQQQQQVVCVACMDMKPFVATMLDLEKERTTANLRMNAIDLNDLDVDAVNLLLQDLLGKCQNDTYPLAQVIILQTAGNIFHILQFLRLLLDQQFLHKKNQEETWTWDVDNIKTKLRSETIMDIVKQTILGLPTIAQEALKVASCMGDEIDDSALDLILQTSVGGHLEQAATEGLLVFFPNTGGYRFAHDWIRQTAYEMTPKREREEFHLKIGRQLWKNSTTFASSTNTKILQNNIFVVVSLLNVGIKYVKEERERFRVAELNLHAAEKAASVSAFPNASKFARKGIQLLPRTRWNDYYELTLSLFSLAAEVEAINGNYERVVLYIEEIINKGRCLEDKLRAYAALIRSMGQQDNLEEATTVGIDVLEQLGEKIPKPTKFCIMKEMMKLSISLRGKSQNDLLQLPPMRNSIKSATLQILNLLFMSSYQARSPYTPLVAVRAMMITLRYGLHEASSVAFATYAMVLCGLNLDVKAARRYGEIAITLAESKHSREHTPIVYYLFGSGVSHWTGPIRATYKDLVYASKTAMEVGDAEIAVLAKTTKCIHALFSGVKLCDVEDELAQCIRTARLYRKQSTQTLCLITLQLIKCWMGETDNPATLTGRCINLNDIIKECENAHNHAWLSIIHLYSMDLAYSFGEYEEALRMAGGCHDQKHCAMFTCIETIYKEGLTAVAVARTGVNKGKNLKIAKENLKRLTAWSKDSSTTLLPKQLLLEAEILSLRGCKAQGKIDLLYEKALQHSLSLDFKKEAALVAERFADYRLRCGDKMEAIDLYIRSIDLYSGWGAEAKCIRLKSYVSTLQT